MSASRNFKLGLFVIGALAALVAIVMILGSGKLTRGQITIESYFDESAQGLDVGSKVKYRGVAVGEVSRISFTNTKYELDKPATNRHQYVLVEARVRSQLVGGRLAMQNERRDLLNQQVERGLRIRLNPQGITGTSYLEIDFVDEKSNPMLAIEWEPDFLYVPSARSTVTQFVNAASELFSELRKVDLDKTVDHLNTVLMVASSRMGDLPIERYDRLATDASALINDLRATNRQLAANLARLPIERFDKAGEELTALAKDLRDASRQLSEILTNPSWARLPQETIAAFNSAQRVFENPEVNQSVARFQRAVGRLERLISSRDSDFGVTLENLRELTDNLRDVTETAKRYPSSLLLGEPPQRAAGTEAPR